MRNLFRRLLTAALMGAMLFTLSACAPRETGTQESGTFTVVATIFPAYDFARAVCGDRANVVMLLPPGSESHSYEPTPQDMITVSHCDLFIDTGGKSDNWVSQILDSLEEPVPTLSMMSCVPAVVEELSEGMEAEKGEEEGDAPEYDEHVWTSPANAVLIVEALRDKLCALDPEGAETYRANAETYLAKLTALDGEYHDFLDHTKQRTIIFGDRFPFRYFAEEFDLNYYAAFPGCSSSTEPSARTIAFLIDKVKQSGVSTVYYMEFSNHLVADSIAEAAGVKTALLHSCHNVTKDQLESGVTYLSLMEQNLKTLKETMN